MTGLVLALAAVAAAMLENPGTPNKFKAVRFLTALSAVWPTII